MKPTSDLNKEFEKAFLRKWLPPAPCLLFLDKLLCFLLKELTNVRTYRNYYREPHAAITQLPRWATWLILFCFCTTHSPTSPPPNCFEANPRRLIISSLNTSLCCAVLSRSVMSDSLGLYVLQLTRLLCPWRFSRQEYWSGLPCPPPGDLPNPGTEPRSSTLQADSLPAEPPGKRK